MPHFKLITNIARSQIPANFMQELTTVLAQTLGKPEKKFSITLIPDQLMIRGGSAEPCGAGYLMSIGKLSSKENIAHSKVIFEKVCGDLKIPMDRLIIEFRDVKDYEVASNGTTIQNAEK